MIIGIAKTKVLKLTEQPSGKVREIPSETYNIVNIVETVKGVKIYITDQEYKPGVPQILCEDLIEEYKKV